MDSIWFGSSCNCPKGMQASFTMHITLPRPLILTLNWSESSERYW